MGKTLKSGILILLFLCCNALSMSAQDPLAYLRTAYPKLTNLYQDELANYPAHYIFAVDVSGTMDQYQDVVTSSLAPFFAALPNKDRVDVIPFGTDALPNMVSYSGIIDPSIRTALQTNISRLYNDPSYQAGFKAHTDIHKAVDAISKVIQNNKEYKVNVIVILTDFRNDVLGDTPAEHKFKDEDLEAMNTAIGAATNNVYTRSVALELPVDQSKPGYCLPQLKESVFPQDNGGLEIVPLTNPGAMIGQWFEQLKRDIMVTKLRAIIDNANRTNPVRLTKEIDIDGNVKAEVHWTPSKLYPTIKIDSTYLSQQGFYFNNNKEAFTVTRDSVIGVDPELYLGKIKNEGFFFHHLNDSLHLGLLLPTEYDEELTGLGIKKPLPNTNVPVDKWIFTFFLPFWLTALIVILIILYIIGVINAIARNSKFAFKAEISFRDKDGWQIGEDEILKAPASARSVSIGSGGNIAPANGAEWTVTIKKVKSNPFLVFAKPYYAWKGTQNYVVQGNRASGRLDYDQHKTASLTCGLSSDEADTTHQCDIRMKPMK